MLVGGICALAGGLVVFFSMKSGVFEKPTIDNAPTTPTRAPVPPGVVVPDPNSKTNDAATAIPVSVAPARPGAPVSLRSFDISVSPSGFTPSTIIVSQGDTVRLMLRTASAPGDFSQPDYGLRASVQANSAQLVEFQAGLSGSFSFFCGSCARTPRVGTIIVKPQ